MDDLTIKKCLCYHIKQVDSMLPWVWTVIHCRRHQNVVRTSVTNWAEPHFLFLALFDIICDPLTI